MSFSLDLSVSPIILYKDKCRVGTATGFFYQYDDILCLVTNRHVLIDENEEHYPDKLKLMLHDNPENITSSSPIEIPLYNKNGQGNWIEYGRDTGIDLAAIKLDSQLISKYIIRPFKNIDLPPTDMIFEVGEDLTVLCYPLGFYDEYNNLPIARTASIASNYLANFNNKPCFLIDSKLHPGTSGAPVLTKFKSIHHTLRGTEIGELKSFLVGVHSSGIEPLDLDYVWRAQLLENFRKFVVETKI